MGDRNKGTAVIIFVSIGVLLTCPAVSGLLCQNRRNTGLSQSEPSFFAYRSRHFAVSSGLILVAETMLRFE